MKRASLIFDIGTGNSRAIVISEDGEILASVRENTAVSTDSRIKNSVVFDPGEWQEAVFRLAGERLPGGPRRVRPERVRQLPEGGDRPSRHRGEGRRRPYQRRPAGRALDE